MKRYGSSKLKTSIINSDQFASDKEFNKLVVNNLSEIDQGTLDHEVIVFNKEDDAIYTYNAGFDSWKSIVDTENNLNSHYDTMPSIYIDVVQDDYRCFLFDEVITNYLTTDSELFDFGPLGSPDDFVVDFWLVNYSEAIYNGTILYNGINTGQVDFEVNKNFLVTTSGSILIKDPNFQANPSTQLNAADDGYLNVYRPRLKSLSPITNSYMKHVAIIRSGDTTYLAIDGKINASAPSVEYFHYDPVKIGAGYVGAFGGGIVNLRVSKGTDRGWTTDFEPPNYNLTVDVNTDFLMDSTSLVDITDLSENHNITVVGVAPVVNVDKFYYQLNETHYNSIIKTNLSQDKLTLRLPKLFNDKFLYFDSSNIVFDIIPFEPKVYLANSFYNFKFSGLSSIVSNNDNIIQISNSAIRYSAVSTYRKYSGLFNSNYSYILNCFDDIAWEINSGSTYSKVPVDVKEDISLMPFKDSLGIIDCHNRGYELHPGVSTHRWHFILNFLFMLTDDIVAESPIFSGHTETSLNSIMISSGNIVSFNLWDISNAFRRLYGTGYPISKNIWYNMIFRFYYYEYSQNNSQMYFTFAPYNDTPVYTPLFALYSVNYNWTYTFMTRLVQGPWYVSNIKYFWSVDRSQESYKGKHFTELPYLTMI